MFLAFLIMTVYIPGHIGFVMPTSWAVMLLGAPLLLLNRSTQFTPIHLLGFIFVAYAAISLLWAPSGYWGFVQILAMAGIFALASTEDFKIEPIVKGLALGLLVSDQVFFLQLFGFNGVTNTTPLGSGLFVNSNIFAEVSALILVLILINRMWIYSIVTLPGLYMSSRAVVLGLAGAAIIWIWRKSKLAVGAILISSLFMIWATSLIHNGSISHRLGIWHDMLIAFNVFGNGIGSFEYLFPIYNVSIDPTANRVLQAHNEPLQVIFELGYVGFIVFSSMIILNWNDKYASWLVCFLIISCFGFPLHIAATAFMFAVVMGHLSVSGNSIWNRIGDFRSALFIWLENKRYA